MSDISFALEAKSDQLNAVDIMGVEPIIRIRDVQVKTGEQPVSVYYDGDNNKPWKPCKGMLRILAGAWGRDSKEWIGKHAKLFYEPSVRYAGQEVGGIRIRSLSGIDQKGLAFSITISRSKREPYTVPLLKISESIYPDDHFNHAFPKMVEKMRSGEMTLPQVIAQCQKTGKLSDQQMQRLEAEAPVEQETASQEDGSIPSEEII